MSDAIKFMKIDYALSKSQNKIFLLFIVVALLLAVNSDNPLFISVYLTFGAVILSTTPFSLESANNMAFVNLLPSSLRNRISGRFMFAALYLFVALVCSEVSSLLMLGRGVTVEDRILFLFPLFMIGVAFIFITIQYVLLYAIGIRRKQQYMRLICMLPGFILFGISSTISDNIKNEIFSPAFLYYTIVIIFALGVIFMIIGKEITIKIMSKRDSI